MSFERFLAVIKSHRRHLAIVWLSIVALAGLANLVMPSRYDAQSSVMVEVKSTDPIAGTPIPLVSGFPNHIPTEIDVVRSERVALRAVRSMGIDKDQEWLKRWKAQTEGRGNLEAWIAEQLLKKLDVRPSRDSNVMTLSYRSPDPAFSAKAVNAFTNAYIETALELRVEPTRQYNAFFDETAKRLRGNLEQAQASLSKLRRDTGLVVTDERVDVENLRLNELSSQVAALQSSAVNAAVRERQSRVTPDGMDEVRRDPLVASLTAEVARQQVRRSELLSRLGEGHPLIAELNGSIAELRSRVESASRRTVDAIGTESKLADGRLGALRQAVEEQRSKILNLMAKRDEARVLEREVENAQRAYEAVLTRASQTALESRGARTNVAVLKMATPPPTASWPKRWLNMAAALVIGLLVAVAAVLVRENRNRRLRSAHDVSFHLGQRLLVVLPGGQRSRERLPGAPARLQTLPQTP